MNLPHLGMPRLWTSRRLGRSKASDFDEKNVSCLARGEQLHPGLNPNCEFNTDTDKIHQTHGPTAPHAFYVSQFHSITTLNFLHFPPWKWGHCGFFTVNSFPQRSRRGEGLAGELQTCNQSRFSYLNSDSLGKTCVYVIFRNGPVRKWVGGVAE